MTDLPGGAEIGVTTGPTLSNQVARIIRDHVLTGRLKPGDRVVQSEWAEHLGVSRMPVRDAINQLAAEGTLVQARNGTAEVSHVDSQDIRDGYELNAIVSSFVARRAADLISDEQLAILEKIHSELKQAVREDDRALAQKLNWEFHRQITRAAGSSRLRALLRLLAPSIPHSAFELLDEWPQRAVHEHGDILEALRNRDAEAAAESMRSHIEAGSHAMLASREMRMVEAPDDVQSSAPD